jgi:hypothetical protein
VRAVINISSMLPSYEEEMIREKLKQKTLYFIHKKKTARGTTLYHSSTEMFPEAVSRIF